MKTELKRARSIRRTIKKAVYFLFLVSAAFFAVVWLRPHYPKIKQYFARFEHVEIDTSTIDDYYDLLSKHAQPGKDLVLDLGVKDTDDLQVAIDRLKGAMGLEDYKIWFAHHEAEKPPAYIEQLGYGHMGILISTTVTERREELNLLAHELSHIYVWALEPSVFGKCDQEKLVDCSSVFLGLGVLTLNGLTDEFILLPGGEGYQTRKKLFGYLEPEQFGYLLARYCAEHGIAQDTLRPFLNSTARKYFNIGCNYLKKSGLAVGASAKSITGIYWCKKCGLFARISLSGKIKAMKCPICKN